MTHTEFETLVLKKLTSIETDVSSLQTQVTQMDEKFENRFDRLDNRMDDMEEGLGQEIRLQWAYLNQAFSNMTTMMNPSFFTEQQQKYKKTAV